MAEQDDSIEDKQENFEENENEQENEQDLENGNEEGQSDDAVDTTADFLKIFQGKTEFDSWEEFSNLFEDFQKETGSGVVFSF